MFRVYVVRGPRSTEVVNIAPNRTPRVLYQRCDCVYAVVVLSSMSLKEYSSPVNDTFYSLNLLLSTHGFDMDIIFFTRGYGEETGSVLCFFILRFFYFWYGGRYRCTFRTQN
jgi:hypothetical protein